MNAAPAESAHQRLVDRLIAEGALWSLPVIQAFRRIPRRRFLSRVYLYQRKKAIWREVDLRQPGDTEQRIAHLDRALVTHLAGVEETGGGIPISSSSQPSLVAEMLEDLRVDMGHNVLEVGAGTGWNAALLGEIVGPAGRVTSVDVEPAIVAEAEQHVAGCAPLGPVAFVTGDGRLGHAAHAPYDRIMVTASAPDLEPAWLEQLAPGGLILVPVSFAAGLAYLVRGTMHGAVFHGRLTRPAYFMPLRPDKDNADSEYLQYPSLAPVTRPAPWAEWFGRRRGGASWLGFSLALAFHAWLRGLRISQHTGLTDPACFGAGDPAGDAWCLLGWQTWHCHGGAPAEELANDLWRSFLNQGGPRPTDYRIRAYRSDRGVSPGRTGSTTNLPRYTWHWDLSEARDRPCFC